MFPWDWDAQIGPEQRGQTGRGDTEGALEVEGAVSDQNFISHWNLKKS